MLTVRRLTTMDALRSVEPAWDALAQAVGARGFAHPYWCIPWFRRLGRGRPFVVTVEDGGDLVGVAPLHERTVGPASVVRFLGHGLGAVSRLLVAPGHDSAADELWAGILDGYRFAELIEYDATDPSLARLGSTGAAAHVGAGHLCPILQIQGTYDEWWENSHRELRRVLRRAERTLASANAQWSVDVHSDAAAIDRVLPELVAIHDAAEAANPRQHLLAGRLGAFTQDLLVTGTAADRIRLFVGRIDGRAVSFSLMLSGGSTMGMWLNRYDPTFERMSPGHLTLRAVVRHAFDEGVGEVDLLIGVPRYKKLWCPDTYEAKTVHAARSSLVFRSARAVLAAADLRRRGLPDARASLRALRRPSASAEQ